MAAYRLKHPRSKTVVTVKTVARRETLLSRGYTEVKTKAKESKADEAKE